MKSNPILKWTQDNPDFFKTYTYNEDNQNDIVNEAVKIFRVNSESFTTDNDLRLLIIILHEHIEEVKLIFLSIDKYRFYMNKKMELVNKLLSEYINCHKLHKE